MSRSPVGFIFAFVAGDGGIFEGAPVGLVAFQCQLLGPAGHVEGHLTWSELLKQAAPQETSVISSEFQPWQAAVSSLGYSHPCLGAQPSLHCWLEELSSSSKFGLFNPREIIWGKVRGELEDCATKTEESMNHCKICLSSHHMKLEPLCSGSKGKQHFQGRVGHAHA